MIFEPWGKTPRLYRDIVVTEKIDGTQGVIGIDGDSVIAGSRNRWIGAGEDHYEFQNFVEENKETLIHDLGDGIHNGEWFGYKINRGYNLKERMFALFNTEKYKDVEFTTPSVITPPVLYQGVFSEEEIQKALTRLRNQGSVLSQGFTRPEGICIYHTQSNGVFKVLLEKDHLHKGQL